MQVLLRWTDPNTGNSYAPNLSTPIAFGRDFGSMPSAVGDQSVSRMVLKDNQVEQYHALLENIDGQLRINDRGSRVGTKVNGVPLPFQGVMAGDRLQIGPYDITVVSVENASAIGVATPDPVISQSSPEPFSNAASLQGADWAAHQVGGDTFGSDGMCNRRVGFLVKRRCGRTSTAGCPHCRNGQVPIDQDPYIEDYDLYPGYGRYGQSYWGYHYYSNRDRYYYDPDSRRVDFTEADAASFEDETDQDYEMNLDAS
ncbi:MAG: FHA domain-containing protein [Cyanobacteria bacterium P01_H01_bin.58]